MRRLRARLRSGFRDESGQTLVLVAISMVVLLSFAGLAIDVGQIRHQQHQLQGDADAAALAGALEIPNCSGTSCSALQNAAESALTENGLSVATLLTQCTGKASGVTLMVNNGPCALGSADPNSGNAKYVEVVVSMAAPTVFARLFGVNSVNVSARAEATESNSPICIYAGSGGFTFNGGTLSAPCAVYDNGSLSAGNNGSVTVTAFGVYGSISKNIGTNFSPKPTQVFVEAPDPLSGLTPPTPASSCTTVQPIGSAQTLSPGTYCGININSGGSLNLNPGTYVIEGTINADGAPITGTGVTLYFTTGGMNMNSSSTFNVTAPTSGAYAGILLWESKTDSQALNLDSSSSSTWTGTIYLPDASLTMNSGSGAAAYRILDAYQITINSSSSLTMGDNYSSLDGGSPVKSGSVLVE